MFCYRETTILRLVFLKTKMFTTNQQSLFGGKAEKNGHSSCIENIRLSMFDILVICSNFYIRYISVPFKRGRQLLCDTWMYCILFCLLFSIRILDFTLISSAEVSLSTHKRRLISETLNGKILFYCSWAYLDWNNFDLVRGSQMPWLGDFYSIKHSMVFG